MRRSRTRGRRIVVALLLCAAVASGCTYGTLPKIDPTGEHVFVPQPAQPPPPGPPRQHRDEPGGQLPSDDVAVQLSPGERVAPINGEVVLVAGVLGPDNYLRTGRRLEWSLAQGSVGHFVEVGKKGACDWLLGDFSSPGKVDATFAVGTTSHSNLRLHRGTPTPADDVYVLAGQGWITLTSPVEGDSYVTVFAPEVYPWDARKQSATVHWVDAVCRFPPPAVNPAGSKHTFTTTVTRQSDHCPHAGWLVRYEIAGGPPAGFAPDGAQAVEVATDQAGQASAEIFQKQPGPGDNRICIRVIRPAASGGADAKRLVVDTGSTLKSWTAPALAVRKTGPAAGSVGATLAYCTEVTNPGDQPARDVVVTEQVPEGLSYVGSNPPAEISARQLRWRLGEIGAYQRRQIQVSYRADRPGSVTACVEVSAAGGLKASHCATTTVMTTALEVTMTAPEQVAVGSQVTFAMQIVNRSQVPATNLVIRDSFDPGLLHAEGVGPIVRELPGTLASGTATLVHVILRVTKAGRLCNRVEITGAGGIRAVAERCVTAVEAGAVPGTIVPPGKPATGPLRVSIKNLGPQTQTVKETARFFIEVSNTGNQPLRNVRALVQTDESLLATNATGGRDPVATGLAWRFDLPAGNTVQLEVHCSCEAAAAKACCRVTATSQEGARAEDEACLTIREAGGVPPGEAPPGTMPGGGLKVTVTGSDSPVPVKKIVTYEIRITNQDQAPDKDVTLVVTVPDGMIPVPLGTGATQPPGVAATPPKFTIKGQTIYFEPERELRPGQVRTYRVQALPTQPGKVRLRVEVTSLNQPQPQIREEATEVLQQ